MAAGCWSVVRVVLSRNFKTFNVTEIIRETKADLEEMYPKFCGRHQMEKATWCHTCARAVCRECGKESCEGHALERGVDSRGVCKLWLDEEDSSFLRGYKTYVATQVLKPACGGVRLTWGKVVTVEGPREEVGLVESKLLGIRGKLSG